MSAFHSENLDAASIEATLSADIRARLRQLAVIPTTDSTNLEIARLPAEQQHLHAVIAEEQSRGRGRRNRAWHSPAGGNIYLSLGWSFEAPDLPLSTLPLAVAVCACRALERAGLQGHGIKWPNDILVRSAKLAGILVDLQSSGVPPARAVIGIGLNVSMPERQEADLAIDLPWTDLMSNVDPEAPGISRNSVAGHLLDELIAGLFSFEVDGFEPFDPDWQRLDLLNGCRVRLEQGGQYATGIARGIDDLGGLLLDGDHGLQAYHSGEVSIRRV